MCTDQGSTDIGTDPRYFKMVLIGGPVYCGCIGGPFTCFGPRTSGTWIFRRSFYVRNDRSRSAGVELNQRSSRMGIHWRFYEMLVDRRYFETRIDRRSSDI